MNFLDYCNKDRKPMQTEPQQTRRAPLRKPAVPQARRTVSESRDILAESQEMIDTLQEKIQQVFYRFGMAGLERLDEAIIQTCQDMMYPEGVPESRRTSRTAAPARAVAPARSVARPAAKPKSRLQSIEEIAAAALMGMQPTAPAKPAPAVQQTAPAAPVHKPIPVQEQGVSAAPDNSGRAFNPLTDMAPSQDTTSDFMSQFEGEKLTPEELAIMQQGLAQEMH